MNNKRSPSVSSISYKIFLPKEEGAKPMVAKDNLRISEKMGLPREKPQIESNKVQRDKACLKEMVQEIFSSSIEKCLQPVFQRLDKQDEMLYEMHKLIIRNSNQKHKEDNEDEDEDEEEGSRYETSADNQMRKNHAKMPDFLLQPDMKHHYSQTMLIRKRKVVEIIIRAHFIGSLTLLKVFQAAKLFDLYLKDHHQTYLSKPKLIGQLLVLLFKEEISQQMIKEDMLKKEMQQETQLFLKIKNKHQQSLTNNILTQYFQKNEQKKVPLKQEADMHIKYLLLACLFHPIQDKYFAEIVAASAIYLVSEIRGCQFFRMVDQAPCQFNLMIECARQIWCIQTQIETIPEMGDLWKECSELCGSV